MKAKMRLFFIGFIISAILMLAICGFAAVDLSTGFYMPGRFAPVFEPVSVNGDGAVVALLGDSYYISAEPFKTVENYAAMYFHLLPPESIWLSYMSGEGLEAAKEFIHEWRYGEEIPED